MQRIYSPFHAVQPRSAGYFQEHLDMIQRKLRGVQICSICSPIWPQGQGIPSSAQVVDGMQMMGACSMVNTPLWTQRGCSPCSDSILFHTEMVVCFTSSKALSPFDVSWVSFEDDFGHETKSICIPEPDSSPMSVLKATRCWSHGMGLSIPAGFMNGNMWPGTIVQKPGATTSASWPWPKLCERNLRKFQQQARFPGNYWAKVHPVKSGPGKTEVFELTTTFHWNIPKKTSQNRLFSMCFLCWSPRMAWPRLALGAGTAARSKCSAPWLLGAAAQTGAPTRSEFHDVSWCFRSSIIFNHLLHHSKRLQYVITTQRILTDTILS